MSDYSVKSGDSLWKIAKQEFKLQNKSDIAKKVYEIADLNNISHDDINNIFIGQKLKLNKEEKALTSPTVERKYNINTCLFSNITDDIYSDSTSIYPYLNLSIKKDISKPEQTPEAPVVQSNQPVQKKQEVQHTQTNPVRTNKRTATSVHLDVTRKFTGTADDLNKHLGGVLTGKGDIFLRMQDEVGINAAFLAAIAMVESANGESKLATKKNNIAGIRRLIKVENPLDPDKKRIFEFRTFASVDDCICYLGKLLKNSYVDNGRTTVASIGAKYCPTNDPTDKAGTNGLWPRSVSAKMNQLTRDIG